ncbi:MULTISPECIES: DNA-3-methyladenine glycosylase I [unclassified Arthrobacter]|uniref:DNA-3-methyladenine glycosylase I n=1 Tax=unclassified Arthrobacter TaxID=235627 RepID=UPI0014917DAE|nr:DNA-3-methyladenine glycosylase I [Arthrobacter sp. AET 35A]MBE0008924.1 DNA-3-methyladenine glycosylase I [Arthrobacter sp. AET 35A]NOJ62596.1 DNA-3-methyladenine glycosylase I [Arthrobacter sp. 147(2020)]
MSGGVRGEDGLIRCDWADSTPDYRRYHDEEWGRPVQGDAALFERLSLEAFQSGLSWLTILRKRDAFRAAFSNFQPSVVAGFDDADVERLMQDSGIVRNRAKILATIANARALQQLPPGESLGMLLELHRPAPRPAPDTLADVPAVVPESVGLAKALKARGFRFVGPTTGYAMLQATGYVNDHLHRCWVRGSM